MISRPPWLTLALLALGLIALDATGLLAQESEQAAALTSEGPGKYQRLLENAEGFRELAVRDYTAALERYASPRGREIFAGLDAAVWPATGPRLGWSFFLSTSVCTAGALASASPVVAFYHPWSDVYLVTEWDPGDASSEEAVERRPRLVSAGVLMGDWLRTEGTPPFSPVPAWVRSTLFKPAALTMTAVQAILAFEAAVPLVAEDDWRARLPAAGDRDQLLKYNDAGVPLLLAASLHNLQTYYHSASAGEDPRLAPVRSAVAQLIERASGGDLKPLRQGPHTLEETANVLGELPRQVYASLQPVAVVFGKQELLVFLASLQRPDLVLSLLFASEEKGRQTLSRVDLLSYSQAYLRFLEAEK